VTDNGRVVVAGAGLAGFRTAKELRALDFTGPITLIGAERRPPYDRPPLSKKVLTEPDLDPSLEADFAALDVDFHPAEAATALEQAALVTDRDKYPFDHLVLATGALAVGEAVAFASFGLDQAVLAGIRWLSRYPQGRIGQLSRCIGISERQLHRRFSAAIGYGPKMFQSVLRFQRLLKTARATGPEQSLADLAVSTGYADQAHMTRDVHRFASLRPTELLRSSESTLQMSDLFKT